MKGAVDCMVSYGRSEIRNGVSKWRRSLGRSRGVFRLEESTVRKRLSWCYLLNPGSRDLKRCPAAVGWAGVHEMSQTLAGSSVIAGRSDRGLGVWSNEGGITLSCPRGKLGLPPSPPTTRLRTSFSIKEIVIPADRVNKATIFDWFELRDYL